MTFKYNPEDLVVWPDGTYCMGEDLEEMLRPPCAMSDDYVVIPLADPKWFSEQGLDENGLELDRNDNLGVYDIPIS